MSGDSSLACHDTGFLSAAAGPASTSATRKQKTWARLFIAVSARCSGAARAAPSARLGPRGPAPPLQFYAEGRRLVITRGAGQTAVRRPSAPGVPAAVGRQRRDEGVGPWWRGRRSAPTG